MLARSVTRRPLGKQAVFRGRARYYTTNAAQLNLSLRTSTGEILTAKDLFANKKVVLVGVPGAFTGTCSKQIPEYYKNIDQLKKKVDTVAVVSVNDQFVMRAWAEKLGIDNRILMLADWDGAFTKAFGQEIDLSVAGLGKRSNRFAAIIENGETKHLFVEPKPAEITVSGVENVLKHL